MSIDRKWVCLALAAAVTLGGCQIDPQTKLVARGPELGEASRQTLMAQVVDPDPHYATPAETSGSQVERAVAAYRQGTVKTPASISTTSGTGGGSGGGSGGGGAK